MKRQLFFALFAVLLASSGCVSYEKQIFFQGLPESSTQTSTHQPDPFIQRGDQLMIMVYALDPESAAFFNQPMGGGQGQNMQMMQGGQGGGFMGYLVDEEGNIVFPKLGVLNVLGYTQPQLRDSLSQWLEPYLREVVVNVRLLNFRVTYITSDGAATQIVMNNKTNLLQFLGMVGGIRWMDKRDNIAVIRTVNEQRTVYRINLTDASVFESPAFYLQPNDIVYVEPNKRKFLETNIQLISYVTSITSAVSILVLFISNLTP
jgi:polysaccharide export outer membrane protein